MEELTWRLQLEKRLRVLFILVLCFKFATFSNHVCYFTCQQTELEQTKIQETAKLQDALRMMQIQINEANAKVIEEREAARKAIEDAPPVVEPTPVIVQDTEKVDTLTAEIESLKVGTSIK